MKVCALDRDDNDRPRNVFVISKARCKNGIGWDCRASFDTQALAAARDEKMHGDARITNDIAQAVDTIVAIPVGDHKRFFVNDAHEAWEVAARRAIHAIRTDSGKRQVWRRFDKGPVWRDQRLRFYRDRGPSRSVIECFQRSDIGDQIF